MKLTIITVSYNSEATIKDTIESVLNQSNSNYEYIIVDGGSKDSTLTIIESYYQKFSLKGISYNWISELDNGIYDAMNKGVKHSRNQILSFINSDDWYEKDTVDKVLGCFNRKPDIDILYGNIKMVSLENKERLKRPKPLYRIKNEQNIYFPSVFIKKDFFINNHVNFDLKYKLASDYKFLLNSFLINSSFFYLNENLSFYRLGGSTTKHIIKSWKEVKKIQKEQGMSSFKAEMYYYSRIIKRKTLKLFNKL